jgi:predicted ferric reductase
MTAISAPPLVLRSTPRPTTGSWWPFAGWWAAIGSVLVVTGLWLGGNGLTEVAGGGSAGLSSVGRLTGLWASDLLLLQVLAMARVPFIERAFGQDRLARWHRWVGFGSFHLMMIHIVLITLGYAEAATTGFWAELWNMIVTYPGMLLATAGTVALILVVVTSVRAARQRLRYESWHLLHLYAYLGVGLALPHQLWTGADFISSPAARAYWWTLYGLAAGAIVVWRLAVPVWRSARHRLKVSQVRSEGPGLVSVYLTGRRLDRLPVRAGQFFQWRFLTGPGWSRAHPYSLSAPPHTGYLRITVKDLGDGSHQLASLRPGTRALIEGPYGTLTGQHYRGGPVLMMAGGIGITPLLSLLGELPYRPGEATLVYRAHGQADLAFREELDRLAAQRGVHVVFALGPRANQDSWRPKGMAGANDVDALRRVAPQVASSRVYVCGPDRWTESVGAAAKSAGVPLENLHTEQFAW